MSTIEQRLAEAEEKVLIANEAITYALERVRTDGEFHEHMDGTQTLGLLLAADAALNDRQYDRTRIPFVNCQSEAPVRCRRDRELAEAYRDVIAELPDGQVNEPRNWINARMQERSESIEGGFP